MKENEKRTEILIERARVEQRVAELAVEIVEGYEGKDFVAVAVLKGAYIFMADLHRALWDAGVDCEVDFVELSSYEGGTESSKNPRITRDLDRDVAGKEVLVVEDIVDTGWSLDFLERYLIQKGVTRVKKVALLSKPSRREIEVKVDYVGFEVEGWVEGCGLDTDQKGRGNPNVVVVKVIDE